LIEIIKRPPLLAPNRVSVSDEGERVRLTIGNSSLLMGYEDAITLSQWLRVHGKKAKRHAGDLSRHWHAMAVMNGAPEK
jgi:hypothetical protein